MKPDRFNRPKTLGNFEKSPQITKKKYIYIEKYLKAPKNPKNFKENLVKFLVPDSISRYI